MTRDVATSATATASPYGATLVADFTLCRERIAAMGGEVVYASCYDGNPIPKARPRFNPRTGRVHSSAGQRSAEHSLGWRLRDDWRAEPFTGPLVLALLFRRATAHRCDLDNLVKLVADAGQNILWANDDQLRQTWAGVDVDRRWPRTVIAIGVLAADGGDGEI